MNCNKVHIYKTKSITASSKEASVPCPPPFSQQQENSRFTSDRTVDSSAGWLIWGKGKWWRRIIGGATASVVASGKSSGGGSNGRSYGGGRCRIEQRLHSTSKPPPPPPLNSKPPPPPHLHSTPRLPFSSTSPLRRHSSLGTGHFARSEGGRQRRKVR